MQWASVDLPQPDGPQIRIFSPLRIESVTSRSVGSAWASY